MSATLPKVANFFTGINHIFCKHKAKQNFQTSSPRTAGSFHVRRDMAKRERVAGQESLNTAGGSPGC